MTITRLRVQNFKSWQDTGEMRLAPITALFGTNSSGKTSLLQLLLLLKQTTESADRSLVLNLGDDRSPVELGTFPEILFKNNHSNDLSFQLEWRLPSSWTHISLEDPAVKELFSGDQIGFEAKIAWQERASQDLGRTVVREFYYGIARQKFGMRQKDEKAEYELVTQNSNFQLERRQGRPWSLPPPSKFYGFPERVWADYQNADFLADFVLLFETVLGKLFYLGPLREYPKRQYTWAGASPSDVGWRGERVVDALLGARASKLQIARGKGRKRLTLEEQVAMWLKELGLIERFEVKAVTKGSNLFQVWVQRSAGAPEVLITDVGFGVSQILPVITLCYYVPSGSTLVLEQPEIHLHPSVQMGLADVFIDAVKTRKIQIILESHSEHLLRRLQRRIAEEELTAADAALYFCTMAKEKSRLEELRVDAGGNIVNWPEDFFGNQFGEIAAMSEAALERKQ